MVVTDRISFGRLERAAAPLSPAEAALAMGSLAIVVTA
jgi:hypothetical protein